MLVTGGSIRSRSVERYDTWTNRWEELPDLLQGRDRHASCCAGDSLYVFCGVQVVDDTSLSSIEQLRDLTTLVEGKAWRLILLPELGSRINLGAVWFRQTKEIAILGGKARGYCVISLTDVLLFDIEQETLTEAIPKHKSDVKIVPASW